MYTVHTSFGLVDFPLISSSIINGSEISYFLVQLNFWDYIIIYAISQV